MLGNLFHTVLYKPMYNVFVLLIDFLPSSDVGIAVIILTLLVSLIILPITLRATRTQVKTKMLEPRIKELQKRLKDNREQQALEMMEIYREAKVNPFSGFFLLLVQLPIVIALYYVVGRSGLPEINLENLYSFVPAPETVNVFFLGLVDVTKKSVVLAAIAAAAQFVQTNIMLAASKKEKEKADLEIAEKNKGKEKEEESKAPSFQDELAKSMNVQMRFVMPLFIGFIAYSLSGVVAIYFIVRSIVTIIQEVSVKKKIREELNHA